MKSVWVVEKGDYSDYRVVGVFSSKDNADRVCAKMNAGDRWGEASVAEWTLDPSIDAINQGLTQYSVGMDADGDLVRKVTPVENFSPDENSFGVWERSSAPAYRGQGLRDVLNCEVWAKDEAHAVKIVNERRLVMLAAGELK